MDASAIRERAADLPREPGVYLFYASGAGGDSADDPDAGPIDRADGGLDGGADRVLYVGKAVDIRDRVRSYADPRGERIRRMVARADGVDYAVTDTETQALLLEANLVKRHQPRYNVRLKDDKSYPMVQLTDHEFPRIEVTRDPAAGATVFGPFTDVGTTESVVKGLRETYGVRGCSDHKFANRDRPCLDHDIGLCTAPCTGEISAEAYVADVASVARFFEGETGVLADPLRRAMDEAAADREFERAANLRDRLAAAESFHGGGGAAVVARDERVVDVLGVAVTGDEATVARLHSEDGKLVDRERHPLAAPDATEEAAAGDGGSKAAVEGDRTSHTAAVLAAFVPQYYAERPLPDALLLSERPADEDVLAWLEAEGVAVRVPGAGREATLVELALKNARKPVGRGDEGLALADELGLEEIERIEGFDVSHAGGTAVVGSNVTFVDGSPAKGDYRRKKLPERNDDYANVRALVAWRAARAVEGRDDRPDPDLLVIDGGRAQLEAARSALREAGWEVPVVALAKERERVVTPGGSHDWASDAPHLHLLQRVRDEAHRFAVQYHGTVRDDVSTALDEVPGIGPALRTRLLRRFGSVESVRGASREELTAVEGVGEATAERIDRAL